MSLSRYALIPIALLAFGACGGDDEAGTTECKATQYTHDGKCVDQCPAGTHPDGSTSRLCVAEGSCAAAYWLCGDDCVAKGTFAAGYHDGGDGSCVAKGSCAAEYHDDGTGKCVKTDCADGYHDDGTGKCVEEGCAATYHDDGTGKCVKTGCAAGYHDDGTGTCVEEGCADGYHDDGAGKCVEEGDCAATHHDDGTGNCVKTGCAEDYHDDGTGACVEEGCAATYHDGGDGVCIENGKCSATYHDDGTGNCVEEGCAAAYHDNGAGDCVSEGCVDGFHLCGAACVEEGNFAAGFHDGGDGACVENGECSAMYWLCGTDCVAEGAFGEGFHNGGAGCVVWMTCSDGYVPDFRGNGACVPAGSCPEGFHMCGTDCVAENVFPEGFINDGAGACATECNVAAGFEWNETTSKCECGDGTFFDGVSQCGTECAEGLWFENDACHRCAADEHYCKGACRALNHYPEGSWNGGAGCIAFPQCSPGFVNNGAECVPESGSVVCAEGATDKGESGCACEFTEDIGGFLLTVSGYSEDGKCVQECGEGFYLAQPAVRNCIPEGECALGYHDDGKGSCSPNPDRLQAYGCAYLCYFDGKDACACEEGKCADGFVYNEFGYCECAPDTHLTGLGGCGTVCDEGYHDDGEGGCTILGDCAFNFHDGGDGTCVAKPDCLAGYHDGGDGKCAPAGECHGTFVPNLTTGECGCAEGKFDNGVGVCDTTCAPSYKLNPTGDGCVFDFGGGPPPPG